MSKKEWLEEALTESFETGYVTANNALIFVDDIHPDHYFEIDGDTWRYGTSPRGYLTGREKSIINEAESDGLTITFPVTTSEFLHWTQHEDNPLGPRVEFFDHYVQSADADELLFLIGEPRLTECLVGRSTWRKAISETIRELLAQRQVPTLDLVESRCRQDPATHEILEFRDNTAEVLVRVQRSAPKVISYNDTFLRHIRKVLMNLKDAARELADKDFKFSPRP